MKPPLIVPAVFAVTKYRARDGYFRRRFFCRRRPVFVLLSMLISSDFPLCGARNANIDALSSVFGLQALDKYSRSDSNSITCYNTYLITDDRNLIPGVILSDESNIDPFTGKSYSHRTCHVRGLLSFGYDDNNLVRFVVEADRFENISEKRYDASLSASITVDGFLRLAHDGPASYELYITNTCIYTGIEMWQKLI